MKGIKIFDEYEEIKKQMRRRPSYGEVEDAIKNHIYLKLLIVQLQNY